MARRWDLMTARARKGQEKPYWHKVGAAFEGDKGINLVFDSLPLPGDDGTVRVSLFEPRERDGAQQDYRGNRGAGRSQAASYGGDDLDDSVPF